MGFISNVFDGLTGGSQKDAIRGVARIRDDYLGNMLETLTGSFGQAKDYVGQGFDQSFNLLGGNQFNPAEFGKSLTSQGFADQIASFSDPNGPFAELIGDRMLSAKQMLGSAGLTRSGNAAEAAAEIPMDVALGLSNQLYGRQFDASRSLTDLVGDKFSSFANLALGQGQTEADIIQARGENKAGKKAAISQVGNVFEDMLGGAISNTFGNFMGGGSGEGTGAGGGSMGGMITSLASLAGMLSDARLKTNIQKIGEHGQFNFYSWDWIPEVEALDLPLMNYGYLAQEVEEIAPEFVIEVFDLKMINYPELMGSEKWQ